jgi:hypothetical protein
MSSTNVSTGNASAERIVRHFQAAGFPGITEALLVRIRLKKGDKASVHAAFDLAVQLKSAPPVQEFFEIRTHGFYSGIRTLDQAKAAFTSDFGKALRGRLPEVFFNLAPVVVDDAMATGTKYDALLKLGDSLANEVIGILLNDPNASFFEYLGANTGYDWQSIVGGLDSAAASFVTGDELL